MMNSLIQLNNFSFRAGSVITDLKVIYNKKFEAPSLELHVENTLKNSIKETPRGQMLGRFRVDKDSVKSEGEHY